MAYGQYTEDKPKDCRYCYFWGGKKKRCMLDRKDGRQYPSEYQQENPAVKKYFKKFSESGCGLSLPAAYPLRGQFLREIRRDGWRWSFLIVH